MSQPITPEWGHLRQRAFNMSCDDQLQLARTVAANIGYKLVPDNGGYDEPTLAERVERLEAAMRELNPGLDI